MPVIDSMTMNMPVSTACDTTASTIAVTTMPPAKSAIVNMPTSSSGSTKNEPIPIMGTASANQVIPFKK